MQTLKFAVLPGDGIGPEVMAAALDVLKITTSTAGILSTTSRQTLAA